MHALESNFEKRLQKHQLQARLVLWTHSDARIWISEGLPLQSISEVQVLLTLKEFCKWYDIGWGADLLAAVSLTRSIPSVWDSGTVALPAAGQYFCINGQISLPRIQKASGRQGWWACPRVSSSLHKARQSPLQNDHVFADVLSFISCFRVNV